MNARDELAELLYDVSADDWRHHSANETADAILAAGWVKSRTIAAQHEFATVANGSVIIDKLGQIWTKKAPSKYVSTELPDVLEPTLLPVTVLYEPA